LASSGEGLSQRYLSRTETWSWPRRRPPQTIADVREQLHHLPAGVRPPSFEETEMTPGDLGSAVSASWLSLRVSRQCGAKNRRVTSSDGLSSSLPLEARKLLYGRVEDRHLPSR